MTRWFLAFALTITITMEGPALADEKDRTPELHAIAGKCGLAPENLTWVDGSVQVLMPDTATFDQVKCVFDLLRAGGIPMAYGLVSGGDGPL